MPRIAAFAALSCLVLALCLAGFGDAAQPRAPDAPVITPAGGTYSLNARVRVGIRGEPGSRIVYTLDGSYPEYGTGIRCESNVVFFDLPPGDVTVQAAAFKSGLPRSAVRRADFVRVDDRGRKG